MKRLLLLVPLTVMLFVFAPSVSGTGIHSGTVVASAKALSKKKARKYAKLHWYSRNQYYEYYAGMWSFKDDCTSFTSQIAHASGAKMKFNRNKKRGLKTTKYWYFTRKPFHRADYTTTWSVVTDFYTYWTKKKEKSHKSVSVKKHNGTLSNKKRRYLLKKIRKSAKSGDIIQFRFAKRGWSHGAWINKKTNHNVYYAQHTTAAYNRKLTTGLKANKLYGVRLIHMKMR